MEFKEYQKRSRETANYPFEGSNFSYPALGVAGEAGEMLNEVKKIIRDDDSVVKANADRRDKIAAEMGDLLWYISQLATELDLDLEEIIQQNLEKTNKLYGSSDS